MTNKDKKDLLEKWQILGFSLMMMLTTPENFRDLVKSRVWIDVGWQRLA